MMLNLPSNSATTQHGSGLIEILITMVILMIGLLGLAGLQAKASIAEMESYQRANAITLVEQMRDALASARNMRSGANGFDTLIGDATAPTIYGTGNATYVNATCSTLHEANKQLCLWDQALRGIAEKIQGNDVGAMLGARGCILKTENPTSAEADYFVVIVWQGISPTFDPPDETPGSACAPDQDFGAGLRRAIVTRVLIPKLVG